MAERMDPELLRQLRQLNADDLEPERHFEREHGRPPDLANRLDGFALRWRWEIVRQRLRALLGLHASEILDALERAERVEAAARPFAICWAAGLLKWAPPCGVCEGCRLRAVLGEESPAASIGDAVIPAATPRAIVEYRLGNGTYVPARVLGPARVGADALRLMVMPPGVDPAELDAVAHDEGGRRGTWRLGAPEP